MIGQRIGSYDVTAKLGEGGMGQVYRGRDTKLDRDVAIKVLPESVAADPDRLARFEREAKLLAALNHPNIAHVFGLEHTASGAALVMELVAGDDLSAVIARGPVAISDALPIAKQIADALEAAHEQGIVHRDLKPGNIKVRPDGTVKVLDFGLAKAMSQDGSGATADAMNSPTLTARATQLGVILGTAAYMAPEQAKGKAVDKRADIWAFGVVLYEMLTGRRAFEGEDVSETMAAVLTREPDFAALPAATSPAIRALLKRCLERDAKRRLRDIGEARMVLESPAASAAPHAAPVTAPATGGSKMWPIAAVILALALVAVSILLWRSPNQLTAPAVRTGIVPPRNITFDVTIDPVVAVSRDGSTIAFMGIDAGIRRLYVRRLADFEPRVLAGTEGASTPFFSPNGQWIGFFSERLKKISVDGGPVIELADAPDNRGAVWTDDDNIIYTPGPATPIYRISANGGGSPVAVSTLDQSKQERTHRWPSLLPGGKEVLVTVGSAEHPDDYDDATIVAIRLDTGARRVVLEHGRMAQYVSSGHLAFLRGQVLHAVPFDTNRGVAGTSPLPLIDGVSGDVTTGSANYSVSDTGTLVFVPGDPRGSERRIAWVDRQGKPTFIDVPPALYTDPHVSPDGKQIAVTIITNKSETDVYIIDAARGTTRRLTSDGGARTAIWSRDSKRVMYTAYDRARNVTRILSRSADGIGEPSFVIELAGVGYTESFAPDDTLIFSNSPSTAGTHFDLYTLATKPDSKPVKVVDGAKADVLGGTVSPDGKWLAYCAFGSGRYEVFVQPYARGGSRTQISTAGGVEPRWSSDSRVLFFAQGASQMAVDVEPGDVFHPSKPREMFLGVMPPTSDSSQTYVVAPTRDGFLMLRPARDNAGPQEIRIIQNWFSELRAHTGK